MSKGPPLSRSQIQEVLAVLKNAEARAIALSSKTSRAVHHNRYPLPGEQQQTVDVQVAESSVVLTDGRFIDVFRNAAFQYSTPWEKALYLAWWAHRPSMCLECGSRDRWSPSADDEYSCGHCSKGSGSTHVNDVVLDVEFGNAEDDMDDESDQEVGQKGGEGAGGWGISSTNANSGTSLISLFAHYFKVLEGLPVAVRPSTETYHLIAKLALDLAELVPLLSLIEGLPTSTDSKSTKQVGATSQFAHDDETPVALIRTASLYIACTVVCPGLVPFPLFLRAAGNAIRRGTHVDSSTSVSGAFACQWMDVASLAHSIGVVLDDFFVSASAIEGHLINVMVIIEKFAPSSVAWSPSRDAQRLNIVLKELAPLREQHSATLVVSADNKRSKNVGARRRDVSLQTETTNTEGVGQRFSPEHTAAFVALELVRLYQGTNPDCARLSQWFTENSSCFPQLALSHGPRDSVDRRRGDLLPTSTWANLLLHIFAKELFGVSSLELAELLLASNLYRGPTQFFEVLSERTSMGFYDLPLQRRLRPLVSPWSSLFSALHSEDRLVVTSLLQLAEHNSQGGATSQEKAASRLLQEILRKHGSLGRFQFNFGLSVKSEEVKHVNGLYFCSHNSIDCSVYTCLRTSRKTIAFDANNGQISLSYYGSKTRVVDNLRSEFVGPVVVQTEDYASKLVLDLVQNNMHQQEWLDALFRLTAREVVKRRLQAGGSSSDPRGVLFNLRRIINEAADTPHTPLTSTCGMIRDKESRLAFIMNAWAKRKSAKELGILRRSEETGDNEFKKLTSLGKASGELGVDPTAPLLSSPLPSPSARPAPPPRNKSGSGPSSGMPNSIESKTSSLLLALERQQLETVLESFEENCLALPAPSFVSGLSVSTLVERFAELHALCEGRYVPQVHPKRGDHKASQRPPQAGSVDPVVTKLDEKIAAIVGPGASRASTAMSTFRLASRPAVEALLRSAVHRYHHYLHQQYLLKQADSLLEQTTHSDTTLVGVDSGLKAAALQALSSVRGSWDADDGHTTPSIASNSGYGLQLSSRVDDGRTSDNSEATKWSDTIVALVESASATSRPDGNDGDEGRAGRKSRRKRDSTGHVSEVTPSHVVTGEKRQREEHAVDAAEQKPTTDMGNHSPPARAQPSCGTPPPKARESVPSIRKAVEVAEVEVCEPPQTLVGRFTVPQPPLQPVGSASVLGKDRRGMGKRRQQNLKAQRFPMDEIYHGGAPRGKADDDSDD